MKKQDIINYNNITQTHGPYFRHGIWIRYTPNGNLWYKGHYINDIKYGYWIENRFKPETVFYIK